MRNPDSSLTANAIIVHWGDTQVTIDLAADLASSPSIGRVVVVANDLAPAPYNSGAVEWLLPPRNLGFAGGFDFGARYVGLESNFVLLNADVRFDEACFEACLQVLADPHIGIVAPSTVNDHGFQEGVGSVTSVLCRNPMRAPAALGVENAEWVTGAIMFISGACYKAAPFNLSYFLYWEDVDLCFRARRAGWRVVVATSAQAWHRGGSTVPRLGSYYYTARNRLWFARIWNSRISVIVLVLWMAGLLLPRTLVADLLCRRSTRRAQMYLRGIVAGCERMPDGHDVPVDEPRANRWIRWS